MYRFSVGALALLLVSLACGPSAAPAPAANNPAVGATAVSALASSGNSATAPPPAEAASARQQVIDGARREGQVNAVIQSAWTPEGIRDLENALEREYGVRIKINHTPVQNYPQRVAELSSELAAGITPSFDLYQTSDANAMHMMQMDLLETVNWAPLFAPGTPPTIVKGGGRLLVAYTDHIGLMYDPTVIAEADVPRSLKDLGDPKYRNRFMMLQYTSSYLPYVVRLGREETLQALRAAMRNGAVPDIFANEYTRFAAKEYPMATINSSYFHTAEKRGIPARFVPLDFSYNTEHHVTVGRRVANPNAAKLLAAVLVSPEGQRITEAHLGFGSRYYEGSEDYKIEQAALTAGFPTFNWTDSPEAAALALSEEGRELQREIEQILKGG